MKDPVSILNLSHEFSLKCVVLSVKTQFQQGQDTELATTACVLDLPIMANGTRNPFLRF